MNYDQPRQRDTDKRWVYTTHNKRTGTRPIGYCLWNGDHVNPDHPHASKFHEDGHTTADEARACYTEYLLDNKMRVRELADAQHKCVECGEWTQGVVEVGGYLCSFNLCSKHQDRATVAKHYGIAGDSMHS